MIVVGLGKAGCNIAKAFSKFPQYDKCIGIDITDDADITIRPKKSHEDYDQNFPDIKRKLKFRDQDVIVVTCGAGSISGGILRLLEQLNKNRLSVLYVEGDLSIMSETQKKQEKIVSGVLQEYARSGILEKIIMVSNSWLEKSIGDMSISGYYPTLNQAIINVIHMLNVFKHTEPVIGNFIQPSQISRICTVGVVDIEDEDDRRHKEKWFYPLTNARDVVYYYGIGEDDLKNDGTLFRKINNFVKSKLEDNKNVSYGVFKTNYKQKYCYCIKYSSMVQSYGELLGDQDIG